MDTDSMIRFEHVSKGYGKNSIVTDFNLEVAEGDFLTVIGRSGCGKTTILKMINGLLSPDDGAVYVEGENVARTDQISLRRRIGYVIQGVGLFPHMNVWKNIVYVPSREKRRDKSGMRMRARELLQTVELEEDLLDRYPSELSGGQRQRVGIARALAANPKILLMDEPFGAVDEITRKALQKEIAKIHRELKITIVFITHDIKEALGLGTRVLVMDSGEIVQNASPEEIRQHPATDFVRELIGG